MFFTNPPFFLGHCWPILPISTECFTNLTCSNRHCWPMPPTPTKSLTYANHTSGGLTNSTHAQRKFAQCFPLSKKVWPIPQSCRHCWLIMPHIAECLTNPVHSDIHSWTYLATAAEILRNPSYTHRKFDPSCPLPQKVWPLLHTSTDCKLLNILNQSHRKFDQSCLLPQKAWQIPPTSAANLEQSRLLLQKIIPLSPTPTDTL